jgi:hypothetical protein
MKRALAVFSVLAVLGFSAFGIGTFSGKWEATIDLLTPELTANTLTLNYTDFGWTFTGVLSLLGKNTAPDTFDISATGAFGPFSINGTMNFDFTPAYLGAKLVTSLDFAGLNLSFVAAHGEKYVGPDGDYYTGCQTASESLTYVLTAKVDPIGVELWFRDCSTGTEFYSADITLKGIGLCCGISLDAELVFTKANGFESLSFSGIEIPLCCGVSLTAGVTFRTGGKELTTGLKWGGIGDTCFTVYGDVLSQTNSQNIITSWTGIEIYGWTIKCSLGDCNYVKFVTALDPGWYNDNVEEVFENDEFEYVELGFCGAGCCGGKYTVDLSVFFKSSGLFGISRIAADMSIPVMSNFTVNVSFSAPDTALSVGWVFTF